MINKLILKFWPFALIVLIVLLFHIRLFLPKFSMYTTPDFGRSDLVNFNIPMKFVLKESLKNFSLPLWEKNIGQGYPVFAEAQVGALYPPNLILFATLPLWLAFNLSIIFVFLTAASGTYLLSRSMSISKSGSVLAALTYTFSPTIILHVQHLNLIQTAAIFPWQLLVINLFFAKREIRYLMYFSIITSMQIFAGFPQIVAYSLLGIIIFSSFKIFSVKDFYLKAKIVVAFLVFLVLSFTIASIQLSATFELTKEAQRVQTTTPKSILGDFPFKITNLKTILNPYIQGSPKTGTYPPFKLGTWGIFWENNLYFGITQLLLILIVPTWYLLAKKGKHNTLKSIFPFIALGLIGIALALGKEAPLHVLFSIPPFSMFRVPSRFLFFTFISAAVLAGMAIDKLQLFKNKKIFSVIIVSILIVVVFDSFRVWFTYHVTENVDQLMRAPELRKYLNNDGRLFSYGAETEWTTKYFSKGWNRNTEIYSFLRNTFSQNSNLLYDVAQHNAYAGMSTRRSSISMIAASEFITSKEGQINIDNKSQTILNANNVKYLTTTEKLTSNKWQLLANVRRDDTIIYLYQNPEVNPRVYIPNGYVKTDTVSGFHSELEKGTDISKIVVLEENVDVPTGTQNKGTAEIIVDKNTLVEIKVDLTEKSLVTISDSFYPGWKAYIDGKETKIYPTNVNSRSVVVPSGHHHIVYKFDSDTIKIGTLVTLAALSFILLLLINRRFRNYQLR